MNNIGILAYGSLIEDPGIELTPLIKDKIENVLTPFKIEFARSSITRDGGPTVVPVKYFGSHVNATILLLSDHISLNQAKDLLWRRETRNENSKKHYREQSNSISNRVIIKTITNLYGVRHIIYTNISANIENPTPIKLAKLAIKSTQGYAGKKQRDGISYLISLKKKNIKTPMMDKYEKEILRLTQAQTLQEALKKLLL